MKKIVKDKKTMGTFLAKAMIELPDGTVVVGDTHDWQYLDNGMIFIKIDGISYVAHGSRVVITDTDDNDEE